MAHRLDLAHGASLSGSLGYWRTLEVRSFGLLGMAIDGNLGLLLTDTALLLP